MPLRLFITIALVLLTTFNNVLQAQSDSANNRFGFLPFSVWYSGGKARAPMLSELTDASEEDWRKDLQQIKALGFNTVRTWVEWAKCEPQPGIYNFDNLNLLMRLAEEVGLKVFIQIYVDSAPDWVANQFPHALFEAQSGDKVHPQSAPGACTDNHEVEEAVLRFYSETARAANRFSNLAGWDLWSEPHIINWASLDYIPNVQFCFCPGTRARFRDWLENKYGNIEALNRAWYRNFSDWTQVDPPRFSTILSYTDFIDWKSFIYEKLVEDMAARYNAIRTIDPNHLITAHAVGASLFQSPHVGAGATDDFLMARPLDYYGVSIYPKHNHPDRAWTTTTLRTVMDFTRSANKEKGGWFVGELQAGLGTISLLVSDPVTADDHRIWIWSAIAKGARGVNIYAYYPMSSGYEAGGYGLINLDGTLTERAIDAGNIARIVDREQALLLSAAPTPAKIGIVYNPLTQMVGGMQRRDYPGAMSGSLIGYYQSFANHNIPVDFIHREHLEQHDLAQYKLIIVPYPIMFTEKAADGIKKFVNDGGYVLAEARMAWNDDRGYASEIIPGMGLHELFGVRENEVFMRESGIELQVTSTSHPAISGLKMGEGISGALYQQTFSALPDREIEVLASDEKHNPTMVAARYGKGEVILAGSYLGLGNFPEPKSNNDQFFVNLLKWAKIDRPFTTSADGRIANQIEVRISDHPKGNILFMMNHSATEESIQLNVNTLSDGEYRIRDIINGHKETTNVSNKLLKLSALIPPRGVQVWEIEAAH